MVASGEHWRTETRRLFALAWPVMLAHMSWILLNMIDLIMVGRSGAQELAYLAIGRSLAWVVIVVGIGLLAGVTVFVARAHGAGDNRACGNHLRQGMGLALVLGLAIQLLIWPLAGPFFALFDLEADLAVEGADYVQALTVGFLPLMLHSACFFFMEGISKPRAGMLIALAGMPVNVALNWLFIYGNLGVPAMGAEGAAWATTITEFLKLAAFLAYLSRFADAPLFGLTDFWKRPFGRSLRQAWSEGTPARRFGYAPGLAAGLEVGGFSYLTLLSGQLGIVPAAAFQVVFGLHMFAFTATLGLGSAAAVRVSNAVGAGQIDRITRRTQIAALLAGVTMAVAGLCLLLLPQMLARAFTADDATVQLATAMMLVIAWFILFDSVQYVMLMALRAAGDQVITAINQVLCFGVVMAAAGYGLIYGAGMGAMGLPWALGIGMLAAAAVHSARFWWLASRGWTAAQALAANRAGDVGDDE